MYKDLDIVAGLKKKSLEWIGRVVKNGSGKDSLVNIWE